MYIILDKVNCRAFLTLIFGTIFLAVGINFFIAPHNLAFGGVTGMTVIIQSTLGIPLYASNLLLSSLVILIGWLELGRTFMVRTLIPTFVLPVFLFVTAPLSTLTVGLAASAVLGAITVGIGISLTMYAGGSTAGPDTIGIILKNRFNIPTTLTMIAIDMTVIICGYHIYGIKTAIWSICVAILMNLTVKLTRDILSKKTVFRYYRKNVDKGMAVSKN